MHNREMAGVPHMVTAIGTYNNNYISRVFVF